VAIGDVTLASYMKYGSIKVATLVISCQSVIKRLVKRTTKSTQRNYVQISCVFKFKIEIFIIIS